MALTALETRDAPAKRVTDMDGRQVIVGPDGKPLFSAQVPLSDAIARNSNVPLIGAANLLDDGTQLVRQRANVEGALLASAPRTAQAVSPDQTNYNGRGVFVLVSVTALASAGFQLWIEGRDISGGTFPLLNTAVTTINAVATWSFLLYPGLSANGGASPGTTLGGNGWVGQSLPHTWRARVVPPDALSNTYSVSCVVLV